MAGRTLDILDIIDGTEHFAESIAETYQKWETLRSSWVDSKRELRNYLFATDTSTSSNSVLPWRNTTTRPKLTQIRDNLEANYMSALFPNEDWLTWAADSNEGATAEKREVIQAYMRAKTRPTISTFRDEMHKLVLDYIDTGNWYATTEYVDETRRAVSLSSEVESSVPIGEEDIPGYVGPRLVRISPMSIVFNPAAPSFEDSPKIIRTLKSTGEVLKDIEQRPEMGYLRDVFDLMMKNREKLKTISSVDQVISEGFQMDGFSSVHHYYSGNTIELLEFIGDIYDEHSNKLYLNHIITVADRRHVLRIKPNQRWRKSFIRSGGWRMRPDNLYAMGPLDNLVGLQYRIDHLENLKADAFDMTGLPMIKVKGLVEDFVYGPGERIYVDEQGDVDMLRPDTGVLSTELEIEKLEVEMELMAGAPREAMGIRSPGEKTKFEVQKLDNAAGRIFQRKINQIEIGMEQLLNDMLELSRRNMNTKEIVNSLDNELGTIIFTEVTQEDINTKGRFYPFGASHFAEEANQLQNLVNFSNSAIGQDTSVSVHISGLALAQAIEKLLSFQKFGLVKKNIRIMENLESEQMAAEARRQLGEEESLANETAIDDEAEEEELAAAEAAINDEGEALDATEQQVDQSL